MGQALWLPASLTVVQQRCRKWNNASNYCTIMINLRRFVPEGYTMKKLLIAILIMTAASPAMAQQAFSSLEEQMSGKEYSAAGLDKLTPEELEALNSWIRSRSLVTLDAAKPGAAGGGDTRGFEVKNMKNMDRTTITSRIVGSFTGWDGQTTFKLENGMIWQQADKDKFYIRAIQNPLVTIEPHAFRTWQLKVEGYNSKVRVERIQ